MFLTAVDFVAPLTRFLTLIYIYTNINNNKIIPNIESHNVYYYYYFIIIIMLLFRTVVHQDTCIHSMQLNIKKSCAKNNTTW